MAQVLWGEPPGPRRGPKPALSREGIARAAIEVADAEGLAAVSMQRVAAALGFTKMSLYRYVPGKTELVALMAESAIGVPPDLEAESGRGWRVRLDAWARALMEPMIRHPWTLEATVGPRVPGPNELAWVEAALTALEGTGLDGPERLDAVVTLTGHVRGIVQQAASVPGGAPEAQLGAVIRELMREHGARYPALAAAVDPAATGARDEAFDFGLARILDGLAALITARSG
ncbi:MAG: TetR family transcriptional regulator [Streptosporangiales bacterium]|nr:TetR family transcriptional regulator [Streptosporangiales bacterium]